MGEQPNGDRKGLYTGPPNTRGGPAPPKKTLIEVVYRGLRTESSAWVHWFEDDQVPDEAKLDQLHYTNQDGYSALHYAALFYRPDILAAAIQVEGADFNVRTKEGLTPLLVASKNNRKNAVLWLLQDGADVIDVYAVDKNMRNAIHLASLNPKCEYTIEPLVRQLGDELCFKKDKNGDTPLHLAARDGNMQAIDNGLLSAEVWDDDEEEEEEEEEEAEDEDTNEEDDETGMKKMARMTNNKHQTALHLAVENGHILAIRKIVSVCPEALQIADNSGNLPIHLACESDNVEVAKELLPTTLKGKRKGKKEANLLHNIVRQSVDTRNSKGQSAADLARTGVADLMSKMHFLDKPRLPSLQMALRPDSKQLCTIVVLDANNHQSTGSTSPTPGPCRICTCL